MGRCHPGLLKCGIPLERPSRERLIRSDVETSRVGLLMPSPCCSCCTAGSPRSCGYSKNKAASGSREQHKPSQEGNATRAAARKRGLQYAKQQESLQSPELLCAAADFRRHFLTPRGPPWPCSQRHPPCPYKAPSAKRGTSGSFARAHPSLCSSRLCFSGFHLKKKPPSSWRAFCRALPGHTRHSNNFKAACWLRGTTSYL